MKHRFYYPLLLTFILISFAGFRSGCISNSNYGDAIISGVVLDSNDINVTPIRGARVKVFPLNTEVYTDSAGYFVIYVPNEATYTLNFSFYGHFPVTKKIPVKITDSLSIRVTLVPTYVISFNNLHIEHFYNINSLSSVNLREGYAAYENNIYKDISFRDSVFLSSDLVVPPGYETAFSPEFPYSYTKTQFDTLSMYDVGGRPIDPNIDFPNKSTEVFTVPLSKHPVYAFYLKGRYNGTEPRIYGLLHIDSVYYDGNYYRHAIISVKINTKGNNWFNPNPD
ncbi:MAG: carboxypeptidase-like regulatory domain-containing protein [Ignavibacteria bacterium]